MVDFLQEDASKMHAELVSQTDALAKSQVISHLRVALCFTHSHMPLNL